MKCQQVCCSYDFLFILPAIYQCPDAHSCLCSAPMQTLHVNFACAKQIGVCRGRKARPGLVILKLGACPFVQLRFQEWRRECECVAERSGTLSECCDFHSRGITETLLSISLDLQTSGRKGRRIRLARKRERERERVGSLILLGLLEVCPLLWRNMECAVGSWDQEGRVRDGLPR